MLKLECTKIDFGWGSAPDHTGELTVLPRLFSWNKGEILLRKGDGAGGEGEKKRKAGKGEKR